MEAGWGGAEQVTQRWNVLILLFVVRLSMAFQFQSVASMSPVLMKQYGVGLATSDFSSVFISRPASPLRCRAARSGAASATSAWFSSVSS